MRVLQNPKSEVSVLVSHPPVRFNPGTGHFPRVFLKNTQLTGKNFKKYTIDNTCPLSSALGGSDRKTVEQKILYAFALVMCPGLRARSPIRGAILLCSRPPLSRSGRVSATGVLGFP